MNKKWYHYWWIVMYLFPLLLLINPINIKSILVIGIVLLLIAGIFLLEFKIQNSQPGTNRFGENPKGVNSNSEESNKFASIKSEGVSLANKTKKFSPMIFGFIIFSFFLPFITVSCSNQNIVTLSGIQLVTGTKINQEKTKKTSGEPLAILAFSVAIIGLGLSFLKGKKGLIDSCNAGIAGLVLLLMLKIKLDNDILQSGKGMLQLKYDIGFWFALFGFFLVALLNGYFLIQKEEPKEPNSNIILDVQNYKFCPKCGYRNDASDNFCKQCGEKLS